MAIQAGRVGVNKNSVDAYGNVKKTADELPAYSISDAGKVLGVDSEGTLEFTSVDNEIPSYSISDAGKILSVNSSGELEFTEPQGGDLYRHLIKARLSNQEAYFSFEIINGISTNMSSTDIFDYLEAHVDAQLIASGVFTSTVATYGGRTIIGIKIKSRTSIDCYCAAVDGSSISAPTFYVAYCENYGTFKI